MESLTVRIPRTAVRVAGRRRRPILVGVVGSGNLEVLVEPTDLGGACRDRDRDRGASASARSGRR